ncbi:ubiquinone/menaquinone biosynthesis C-methylase UbiE [Nonomuraea thailandensis]|uniref:Ubiquinone/menaquinone biosynthesis C-methylase UbiE n=1 Tax=Nonomuraea thailandensis TaxID=1188745 RepID=A0A9X2GES6_9ACTN|nr:class I SAM-dependent methyltransferase [Nonomuraea thailandensis]MCP2356330.1 ubiquinone/menaquinone biosynthesis C-methylase UbiE [Nonomuraea thailandensis]
MTSAGIGTVFDSAATHYAEVSPLLWNRIGEATVTTAAIRPGERVLDVCCGAGASAIPAARSTGPQGHVDAIDLAAGLLAHGRRRAVAEGLRNVRFVEADATTWEGSAYDVVQCVHGVFFLPDMDASVSRLAGLLRPGGRLVVTTWAQGAMEGFGRLFAEAVAHVRQAPVAPPTSRQPASRIGAERELGAWLTARGLTRVTVTRFPLRLPLDAAFAWQVVLGSGFRGMLAGLEEPAVERVRAAFGRLLREGGMAELDATSLIGAGTLP